MPNSLNSIMSFSVGSPSLPGQQRRDDQCYNQRSLLAVKCLRRRCGARGSRSCIAGCCRGERPGGLQRTAGDALSALDWVLREGKIRASTVLRATHSYVASAEGLRA